MSDSSNLCPECGRELPDSAPHGLCSKCLVSLAIGKAATEASEETREDANEAIGSSIGRYRLLEQIGEGGFGAVYMAEQREPVTRKVALKIIKLGMDTKQVIARFESERQALAMMDHPNIARVLDAGTTESGRPYFVMELVRGVPITKFCDDNKLTTKERLAVFMDVCAAVQHAHQKGIIHRDLKPNNILVTMNDDKPMPKVIDFGIAKATAHKLTDLTLFTQFHQFVGTPAYMSPEQAQMNNKDVDTRSDIYALGVLLYELLTGKTPFDAPALMAKGQEAVFRAIQEEEPPRPSTRLSTLSHAARSETAALRREAPDQLRGSLKGDLDWVIMKALEKDRTRRYDTANAFAVDIRSFLDGAAVSAVPPSKAYRMRKFVSRNRVATLAGTAVVSSLVLGLGVALWSFVREREASTLANQEKAKAEAATAAEESQRRRAQMSEQSARKNLYHSDMKVLQLALETGNMENALTILHRHIPGDGDEDLRDFEWRHHWTTAHRELFNLVADDDAEDDIKPDPVFDLALSPQGDLLASASREGVIRVWDLKTRSELFQFNIVARRFAWVDISPDGQHVAASGQTWNAKTAPTPEVVVWNIVERRESHRFTTAPTERVRNPTFLSNTELCAGAHDGTVWVWNLETGKTEQLKRHDKPITSIAVSPNKFATIGSDNQLHLWDSSKHTILSSIEIPEPLTDNFVLLSQDHRWIASHREHDTHLTIHNAESRNLDHSIILDFPIHGLATNQDSSLLAAASTTGTIHFFRTSDWKEVDRYHHRSHQLNVIAIASESGLMVSGGDNGVITAWPGKLPNKGTLQHDDLLVTALMYSPDGRYLAAGTGGGGVIIWDAATETRLLTIPEQKPVESTPPPCLHDFLEFSPDSRMLAIASSDGDAHTLDLWEIESSEKIRTLPHPKEVKTVSWASDGQIATHSDEQIRLWNADSGEARILPGNALVSMAFSPDVRLLATEGYGDDGIKIWDVQTGDNVATLTEHVEPVGDNEAVLFSPDGKLLATAGYDSRVILWDTTTWEPVRELLGHLWIVVELSFSPDGKRLASTSPDNQCLVWDVETGREVARFTGLGVDFSPDGNALAVSGEAFFNFASIPADAYTVRIYRAPSLIEIDKQIKSNPRTP